MSENTLSNVNAAGQELSIFVTDADKRGMDISAMSDFMSNRISTLAHELIDQAHSSTMSVRAGDIALIQQALLSRRPVVKERYEYILDYDSLPKDVLSKFKKGIYKLGESRQVDGNLRAVIVDETGTRVKDLTLKRGEPTAASLDSMQNIAIQAQLRQIDAKLDTIIELQGYQIDFARNNAIIKPFFDARDQVVHAQNESIPERRRHYLDSAVSHIEDAMNAIYLDIETIKKRFLRLNRLPIPFLGGLINQYIGYIAQDLQLLAKYNGVFLQVLDYMGKKKDKLDAFEKYKRYMLGFYTEAVGPKQLPLSLQIHNAFDASQVSDRNVWKNMTDEMVPALLSKTEVSNAMIISMEDDPDEEGE